MAEPVPVIIPTTQTPASEALPATPTLTPEPTQTPSATPIQNTPTIDATLIPTSDTPPILYYSQSGDTLSAVAARFSVETTKIASAERLSTSGLIDAGTLLVIPDRLDVYGPNAQIMPDSEFIFSVSAADFDIYAYNKDAGGALSNYREYLSSRG
jgi:LysM repeat protein